MSRKIVVGDDQQDFVMKSFIEMEQMYGEDFDIHLADTPENLIRLAEEHPDALVITDLHYTDGMEHGGYKVLNALADTRDVYLWTGNSNEPKVIARATELGAKSIVAKNRLGEIFGYTEEPDQETGTPYSDKVLVICSEGYVLEAVEKTVSTLLGERADRLKFISHGDMKTVEGRYMQIVLVDNENHSDANAESIVEHSDRYRDEPLGYNRVRATDGKSLADMSKKILAALND